jgi:hypothetical protein
MTGSQTGWIVKHVVPTLDSDPDPPKILVYVESSGYNNISTSHKHIEQYITL